MRRTTNVVSRCVSIACAVFAIAASAQRIVSEPTLRPLDNAETIPVYIAAGDPASAFQPQDRDLAEWALASWAAAAEGRLSFRATPSEAEALVRIYFVAAGAGQYGEMRGFRLGNRRGAAVFIRPDTGAFGDRIALRADEDPLFRDSIVFMTCLHELGHALGLVHTANYEDIMYAFGYGGDIYRYFLRYRERLGTRGDIADTSGLSEQDVAQLAELYPPPSGDR